METPFCISRFYFPSQNRNTLVLKGARHPNASWLSAHEPLVKSKPVMLYFSWKGWMKKLLNDLNDNAQQSWNTERINNHFCVAWLIQIKKSLQIVIGNTCISYLRKIWLKIKIWDKIKKKRKGRDKHIHTVQYTHVCTWCPLEEARDTGHNGHSWYAGEYGMMTQIFPFCRADLLQWKAAKRDHVRLHMLLQFPGVVGNRLFTASCCKK